MKLFLFISAYFVSALGTAADQGGPSQKHGSPLDPSNENKGPPQTRVKRVLAYKRSDPEPFILYPNPIQLQDNYLSLRKHGHQSRREPVYPWLMPFPVQQIAVRPVPITMKKMLRMDSKKKENYKEQASSKPTGQEGTKPVNVLPLEVVQNLVRSLQSNWKVTVEEVVEDLKNKLNTVLYLEGVKTEKPNQPKDTLKEMDAIFEKTYRARLEQNSGSSESSDSLENTRRQDGGKTDRRKMRKAKKSEDDEDLIYDLEYGNLNVQLD